MVCTLGGHPGAVSHSGRGRSLAKYLTSDTPPSSRRHGDEEENPLLLEIKILLTVTKTRKEKIVRREE